VSIARNSKDLINATGLCLTADTEKGGISPDPALAALAAAPSFHRRENADEVFAPIPYQWEEE